MTASSRSEHDLLGDRDVPADAYWGVHTLRATENFPITGTPISAYPHLIDALAAVKEAAALANGELGLLEPSKAAVIVAACQESTNDVYPTAVRIATVFAVRGLLDAMAVLQNAFADKAAEFHDVLKMGRTQLQDAVSMTLGQEFSAFAGMLDEDRSRLAEALGLIHEINLGATAIGTGLNAPAGYAEAARRHLADITGLPLVTAPDLVEAAQDCGAFVQMSGVLKRIAVKLSKTCNDLRLLSSGPRAGLGEINLPPVQAGSSIMPGKVNPVIPEVVNQVAFEVIGNDITITMAAEAGQLQLNAFEPVILHSLSKSVTHVRAACLTLAERCVSGITANTDMLRATVEYSIGLVTALNPYIGYTAATDIAKEALATGRGVAELVLERGLLPAGQLSALLRPEVIAGTGPVRT
ncbi:lyase family protein [Streptomyces sp. NPDC086023]|uniref:aspartate ammonia-lyase n=1 Tax=Streptomyces sp. NPDC086023 TaxID=3365746 RepID=UPI0037D570B8